MDAVSHVPAGEHMSELAGSHRSRAAGSRVLTPLPDDSRIEATLILRRRNALPAFPAVGEHAAKAEVLEPMEREQFAARYGADPEDVARVIAVLTDAGAEVTDVSAGQRRIRISGPAGNLTRLFGTQLHRVVSRDTDGRTVTHRQREGSLSLPASLDGIVTAVLGLDDRPQAHVQFRVAPAAEVEVSYTPPQLGVVYDFPSGTDGTDHSIAIIELGGGFDQADLDTYFKAVGVERATPGGGSGVTAVGVDGASNQPGSDPSGADAEVLLDIEVAAALAPASEIVVYFAPNTDAGFVDAVSEAAHAHDTPTVMSISWGQSEDEWTEQARTALDDALADAVALGITVTAAAGDSGSSDREAGGSHVDFPASSPHTLACGGTSLRANPVTGAVSSETVWNNGAGSGATGGGVSDAFGLPPWQDAAGVPTKDGRPGRGVPDVAAVADPRTGYWVRVDGRELTIGGTSAVAPLWAALVARLAQAAGRRFGLIQPRLYTLAEARAGMAPGIDSGGAPGSDSGGAPGSDSGGAPGADTGGASANATGFRDITVGNNGAYEAKVGWDACTGLGVPVGTQLKTALTVS